MTNTRFYFNIVNYILIYTDPATFVVFFSNGQKQIINDIFIEIESFDIPNLFMKSIRMDIGSSVEASFSLSANLLSPH